MKLALVCLATAILGAGVGRAQTAPLSPARVEAVMGEASDAADDGDYQTVNEKFASLGNAGDPVAIEAIRLRAYKTALSDSFERGIEMLDFPKDVAGLIDANVVSFALTDFATGKLPLSEAGRKDLHKHYAQRVKSVVEAVDAIPKGFRHEALLQLLKLRETAEEMGVSLEIPSHLRYLKDKNASLADERVMFEAIDLANGAAPKTNEIMAKLTSIAHVTSFKEAQNILSRTFGNTVKALLYRGSGFISQGDLDKGLQSYREAVNFMNRHRSTAGLRGVESMVRAFNSGNRHTLEAIEQQMSEGDHDKAKQVLNIVIEKSASMTLPFMEMEVPTSLASYLGESAQKALAIKHRQIKNAKVKAAHRPPTGRGGKAG